MRRRTAVIVSAGASAISGLAAIYFLLGYWMTGSFAAAHDVPREEMRTTALFWVGGFAALTGLALILIVITIRNRFKR